LSRESLFTTVFSPLQQEGFFLYPLFHPLISQKNRRARKKRRGRLYAFGGPIRSSNKKKTVYLASQTDEHFKNGHYSKFQFRLSSFSPVDGSKRTFPRRFFYKTAPPPRSPSKIHPRGAQNQQGPKYGGHQRPHTRGFRTGESFPYFQYRGLTAILGGGMTGFKPSTNVGRRTG